MSLHRMRAHIRFTTASGLATWSRDQMNVRYQQAVVINENAANEESPLNEVIDEDDGQHQVFRCDLPLADEAAAADAFNTLSTATVLGQAVAFENTVIVGGVDGQEETLTFPSSVEHHTCYHDEDPPSPCQIVSRETQS